LLTRHRALRHCIPAFLLSAGLIFLTVSLRTAFAETPTLQYVIRVAPDLEYLEAQICFPDRPPARLLASGPRTRAALQWVQIRDGERRRALDPGERSINLSGIKRGDCLRYRVELNTLSSTYRWGGGGISGKAVITDPDDWLWLPPAGRRTVEIRFLLPSGVDVSAPWELVPSATHDHTYHVPRRSTDWNARVAIGHMNRFELPMAGTTLRVSVLAGKPPANPGVMRDWIESGARAITTLRFSLSSLPPIQVLIVPVGRADEPVPWGEVQRGGGEAVHLFIDQHRSRQAFVDDWTLVHEVAHLLHPRLPKTDAWLYEGLASYYQNVLRARASLLTPLAAWHKLHAGFLRGIRGTTDRQPLYRVSGNMGNNGRYMQIYWSGAAYALEVDSRLREQSAGHQSLDTVLGRFLDCCLPADRRWTGKEFVERLDALSETTLFSEAYERYRHLRRFPDLDHLYRNLGLKVANGGLQLDDSAPRAPIRRSIMSQSYLAGP